jgi:hypothetical protein
VLLHDCLPDGFQSVTLQPKDSVLHYVRMWDDDIVMIYLFSGRDHIVSTCKKM